MLAPVASGRGSAIGRLARHVRRWFRAKRDYHHVSELPDYLLSVIYSGNQQQLKRDAEHLGLTVVDDDQVRGLPHSVGRGSVCVRWQSVRPGMARVGGT